jgi:hypothetical protein
MKAPRVLAWITPLAGALVGLSLAFAFPYRYGGSHSCPPGARVEDCTYPADLPGQRIAWTTGGVVVGLLVVGLARAWSWWRAME